jgi:hypothetical protein
VLEVWWCVVNKGVVPRSILSSVRELILPADQAEAAKKEAESLPAFDVTEVSVTCHASHGDVLIYVLNVTRVFPVSVFIAPK